MRFVTIALVLLLCPRTSVARAQSLSVQAANHPSFEAEIFFQTGDANVRQERTPLEFDALRDRRALEFDVRLGRLRFRCQHALRRLGNARESLAAGTHSVSVIDLREYCQGRAYRAIAEGASIVLEYGRAAAPALRHAGRRVATVRSEPFVWPVPHEVVVAGPLTVSLEPQTSARPVFAVRIEGEPRYTFISPDDLLFVVRGPEGTVYCQRPLAPHGPIARELFRAPRRGRPLRILHLLPSYYCPARTFAAAGIYEVLASAHSSADAAAVHLRGFVGEIYGPYSWVQVPDRRARRENFVARDPYDNAQSIFAQAALLRTP